MTTSKVTPTGLAGLRLIAWPGSSTAAKLNFVHGLETTNFGLILHVDCPANIFRGSAVSELVPFKYRAFLSYSHRDKAWGKWLHGALEGYRIDKDLIGRETTAGMVPKTLRPIFRDREDFFRTGCLSSGA